MRNPHVPKLPFVPRVRCFSAGTSTWSMARGNRSIHTAEPLHCAAVEGQRSSHFAMAPISYFRLTNPKTRNPRDKPNVIRAVAQAMKCGGIPCPICSARLANPAAEVGNSKSNGQIMWPILRCSLKLQAITQAVVERPNPVGQPPWIRTCSPSARHNGGVVRDPDRAGRTNKSQ